MSRVTAQFGKGQHSSASIEQSGAAHTLREELDTMPMSCMIHLQTAAGFQAATHIGTTTESLLRCCLTCCSTQPSLVDNTHVNTCTGVETSSCNLEAMLSWDEYLDCTHMCTMSQGYRKRSETGTEHGPSRHVSPLRSGPSRQTVTRACFGTSGRRWQNFRRQLGRSRVGSTVPDRPLPPCSQTRRRSNSKSLPATLRRQRPSSTRLLTME